MSTLKDKMISYTEATIDRRFLAPRELSADAIAKEAGKKNDQEKPDLSLLPRVFLEGTARAFMHGEKKYNRYNYRNGIDWHRLVGAAMRHITAFNDGEDIDQESGNHHLWHASASIAMLIDHVSNNLGKDTRDPKRKS